MHKTICALMMTLALPLAACGGPGHVSEAEKLALEIRSQYLELTACSGHMDLTADYGRRVYDYGVDFSWEREGDTVLTLTAPENVAGVTASIRKGETALEYDGVMVETGELDRLGMTPVAALTTLLNCAREGYLAQCALEGEAEDQLLMVCRDPEEVPGTGMQAQLWFDPADGKLLRGELGCDGVTELFCTFTEFEMTGPAASDDKE